MTPSRPTPQLGHLEDTELARLAAEWRTLALRGDREAFGIAHALEVEQRRRLRPSQMADLQPVERKRRPWWRFWSARSEDVSQPVART